MATQIDVVNAALIDLGESTLLTALDDETRSARIMGARWELSRLAVLEARPWSFARTRIQLAATQTAPLFGPAYAFDLPNDFIRFLQDRDDPDQDFRREGHQIVSEDGAPLDVVYIADVDIGTWTPQATDCLAAHLAARAAIALTGDRSLRDDMEVLYQKRLTAASMADQFNQGPTAGDSDVWLRSRRQGA